MEEFKYLSDEELTSLTTKQRREYQKAKKEYENRKMVNDIITENTKDVLATSHANKTSSPVITKEKSEVIIQSSNESSKKNTSETKKKSNAGRKKILDSEKKQQIMLTIEADSKYKLESVDAKNFKKLLGRYIDKNIDSIIEALEKL